ncbi:cytochrome P450 [Lyophyllum atratum]|nr:cytochrome P450 [Lyophyllum atratum]
MLDAALPQQLAIAAGIVLVTLGAIYARSSSNSGGKLPPGPPGIPFLGNVLQLPGGHLATYFRTQLEKYGGLVYLNLAGNPVILIGDVKLAKEILERRAAKFSSRPVVPYVRNHVDPTMAYWGVCEQGESHRIGRKLTAGLMSDVRAGKTESLQEFEAILTTKSLIEDSGKDWFHHLDRVSASMVLAAGFGMHCPTGHEPELKEIISVIAQFVSLATPSASIINVLPFLDKIPGPMPWKTRAAKYRKREDDIYNKIINEAVSGKASGMNTWAAQFASEDKPEGDQRRLMNQFTGAAIETTALSLQVFILACLRYPEWIPRAQKEIDAVVGEDRLPTFKDRPYLPYVEAIVRETLRWRPAARFGVPHMSTESDVVEYEGQEYFIPKGSIIFAVPWAIEHEEKRFVDRDRFEPARFLDAKGNLKADYETSAFGFGRRMCPGVPFAERSMWINIAIILWTFNIRKSKELDPKTGKPFTYSDTDAAFSGEFSSAPFKFPAVFEPRSPQRAEVAKREWAECEKDLNVLLPQAKEK